MVVHPAPCPEASKVLFKEVVKEASPQVLRVWEVSLELPRLSVVFLEVLRALLVER
jgi:hypothetical protein